jgi:hypothetical protein
MNNPELYDILDKFIENNNPVKEIHHAISMNDLNFGKELYYAMKNSKKTSYEIFGSNGFGYTCYSLYQSKEEIIYLFVINIQKPIYYLKIENEKIFD